jgi:formylglycine-generating enzyme required for sulfatase activity
MHLSRPAFVAGFFFLASAAALAQAGAVDWSILDAESETIPGPADASATAAWHAAIAELRVDARDRYGLSDREYARPELKWAQSSFVQPQMMIHDRCFYDPARRAYTVDRYLGDLERRYGRIDSVLIWHGYPNIGIDNRNQFDLFADQPGGIAGVRRMIADFHRRHVRVLYPMYAWDQGTRRTGEPLWEGIARELAEVGADGVNGDTLDGVPLAYRVASDRTGHPLALEPEGRLGSLEMLAYNCLSWGYWGEAERSFAPPVSRYKWLEPRHLVNLCERWTRDHTNALQAAFFNGVGFESWENVWGIWNGMTDRDGEALRRTAAIEREFAALLVSSGWRPYASTVQRGVFASRWPGDGTTLWTFVNRNPYDVSGVQLALSAAPGARYFDAYHGVELKPVLQSGRAELSFGIEALGFGAVLETRGEGAELRGFLAGMARMVGRPLASYSREWKPLPQQLVAIAPTHPAASAPPGMVLIPAAAAFDFRVEGTEIEGENLEGTDVQYPWETAARRYHDHVLAIKAFWIDRTPVTNAQFERFLAATNYRPADDHNFLRDWSDGACPPGWASKPVTWVSIEDARAYARWAGKRLPHEWEWQYAAQGLDHRRYPWGNHWIDAAAPAADGGTDLPPPADVDAHPGGASPFGVLDLVGNVWQWTDEFTDEHTRAAVLRGGSHYRPGHSLWYFPQAKELDRHGKLLLMAPSIDRSGTVGFRCVQDWAPGP